MSELISGKEALIALANGEEVQFCDHMGVWHNAGIHTHAIGLFLNDCYEFRLKPRTITINNIEVPAPFEPKDDDEKENSYVITLGGEKFHWRAPSDYKQVVSALRSVFKPQ